MFTGRELRGFLASVEGASEVRDVPKEVVELFASQQTPLSPFLRGIASYPLS